MYHVMLNFSVFSRLEDMYRLSHTVKTNPNDPPHGKTIRAVAGQRSSPDLCFVTKSITSMTKDIDLNVTQEGRDGTA